jgi:DNA-binding NtrC family response regulator
MRPGGDARPAFPLLVGKSGTTARLRKHLEAVAGMDAAVLLAGEPGVGKEAVARALHAESRRASGPFVTVSCGSVPAALLEAELCGYKRGAFPGAERDHAGYLRQAEEGTLVLDEVSELPIALQARLADVLERRRVRPLGAEEDVAIDVRIVATSTRDVRAEAAAGRFHGPLLDRLARHEIRLPPLRERADDMPELALQLLARAGRPRQAVSEGALQVLAAQPWPGNLKQLEAELLRASVRAGGHTIRESHLSPELRRPARWD